MSLFLAWMPDGNALEQLCALRDHLRANDAGKSWQAWRKDAQLHMTLRYLADAPPATASGLREAIATLASNHAELEVRFDHLQAWAPALVACTTPDDALAALLADLDAAAVDCGYPRMRPQTPHATLAYPPRGTRGNTLAIPPLGDAALLPFIAHIRNISVVQTDPGRGYRRLATWPLRSP